MDIKKKKESIIQAGYRAVDELIKVAKEPIVETEDDVSADRLKNAAATKKLAIFDAFEILTRIENEKNLLDNKPIEKKENTFSGFAEKKSK
tara:strand:+ start:93 stop:365 length:273 start_codon:yes stop_codon:yes gene_type:complete